MKSLSESNAELIATGWMVEMFDSHQIAQKADNGKFYLSIRSPQARSYGGRSGRFYSFNDEQGRATYLTHWRDERQAKIAKREQRKAVKAEARKAFVNPHKVGDILYSSWGYDQTNVEFFKIKEIRPRALKIVEIASDVKETSFMSGPSTPIADREIDAAKWVTIQINVWDGKIHHSIPSPIHGNLYRMEDKTSVHCSWYA